LKHLQCALKTTLPCEQSWTESKPHHCGPNNARSLAAGYDAMPSGLSGLLEQARHVSARAAARGATVKEGSSWELRR